MRPGQQRTTTISSRVNRRYTDHTHQWSAHSAVITAGQVAGRPVSRTDGHCLITTAQQLLLANHPHAAGHSYIAISYCQHRARSDATRSFHCSRFALCSCSRSGLVWSATKLSSRISISLTLKKTSLLQLQTIRAAGSSAYSQINIVSRCSLYRRHEQCL